MYTPQELPEEECIHELRRLFSQAVERHLVSDVPVGAYLSGGMDSGSITAVANRKIPRMMSFTGGFDLSSVSGLEATFDEREPAEFMSSCFGTEHYEMVMHSGDMAWVMPKMIWHLEDLRVGMCWQNYYIARLASKFVKVVLSGTGGDENFAGYPWRYLPIIHSEKDLDEKDRRLLRILAAFNSGRSKTRLLYPSGLEEDQWESLLSGASEDPGRNAWERVLRFGIIGMPLF